MVESPCMKWLLEFQTENVFREMAKLDCDFVKAAKRPAVSIKKVGIEVFKKNPVFLW